MLAPNTPTPESDTQQHYMRRRHSDRWTGRVLVICLIGSAVIGTLGGVLCWWLSR